MAIDLMCLEDLSVSVSGLSGKRNQRRRVRVGGGRGRRKRRRTGGG